MKEFTNKIQVEPSHYEGLDYDNKSRWISYWHQINEILKLEPETVLEIGIGSGVVSNYLKNHDINITTMDIDERLKPDEVGSILDIPFPCNRFEVIACFEVLEHIPYSKFVQVLKELERVAKNHVLISVPDVTRAYRFNFELPRKFEIKKLISLPRLKKPVHEFDGQHHWEIGKRNYPLNRIIKDMEIAGLKLLKTFRIFEKTNHRFFILEAK